MSVKKKIKSTFKQLASTKKHECKVLTEYLLFFAEFNYTFVEDEFLLEY